MDSKDDVEADAGSLNMHNNSSFSSAENPESDYSNDVTDFQENSQSNEINDPLAHLLTNSNNSDWGDLPGDGLEIDERNEFILAKNDLLDSPVLSKEQKVRKDGKTRKELEEEEREKMQVLVSNFTEDQLDRYEMYRRSAFPKAAIKRVMQTITGCSVAQNVVIAMSGISKVFASEIVEEALDVMEEWNESGPLQPKHLREAVRKMRLKSGQHVNCLRPKRQRFHL